MPHRTARIRRARLATLPGTGLAATVLAALCSLPATAETSPYYVGISQSFSHESNLLRLRDGQPPQAGTSESDTISSTALVAGIDQRFGRQRVNGSATLRSNRYSNNKQFNGQSYNTTLALDWETIERLNGTVSISADRAQRADLRDRLGQFVQGGNNESRTRLASNVNVGLAGPLGLEAGVTSTNVKYSNDATDYAAYREDSVSAGVRYRLGGATSVSLGLRQTRTDYPNLLISQADPRDKRTRNDLDIGLAWVPSGASRLDARFSQGKTKHDQLDFRDFSGSSGAISWSWSPGGKLRVNTRLARDIGQSSQFITNAGAYAQTTDSLRVAADYDLTGKITLNSALQVYRRNLERSGQLVDTQSGSDTTNIFSLGARWAALRSLSVGCQASYEKRASNSNILLNEPYSANSVSCFGQLVLQ
jgi:hypothetical protein